MGTDAAAERLKRVRLAELRQQVQSGTYSVDACELSRKIIEQHIVIEREPMKGAVRQRDET